MLARIVPPGIAVAESFGDLPDARLFPAEEAGVRGALDGRRREYTTVRHLARIAMRELAVPPAAVPPGARREPLWPAGIVGSMTHCAGYRAAALGRADRHAAIGVDAEPHRPLPPGVLARIASRAEPPRLARLAERRPDVHWDCVLFSAKEAVYKAWFALTGSGLAAREADVGFGAEGEAFGAFGAEGGAFGVEVNAVRGGGAAVARRPPLAMSGRWYVDRGLVFVAVTVTPRAPAPAPGQGSGSAG
ncbi:MULTISPECIES: 4'-phosphopantetheinyl transferase [unclassified Streptomyces]|uniref:4'-phosphopantetheinyl transferase family protein n=1 Tax=unclassified Streptomyces TaxID=2593676 RepID=UPI00278BD9E0|nr:MULTISPECIES: 4'-phosphopantetheinyl transferase superfamily protein [unclassified Streptomyces]